MKPVMLVTGGSQGIGAAVVRQAAAAGWRVGFTYARSRDRAVAIANSIKAESGEALAIQAEMASEADIVRAFDTVERAFGTPEALVNNAGITGPVCLIENITAAIVDEVMAVNVRALFIAIREAARRMSTNHGGRGGAIVNISSRASGLGGGGEWVHYAASKGAVDTLTLGAAKELAPHGIRVNAINPGLIDTELHARAGMPDRVVRMQSGVPMGRAGSAEEVARAVIWLASAESSYVTGALLPVSGGR